MILTFLSVIFWQITKQYNYFISLTGPKITKLDEKQLQNVLVKNNSLCELLIIGNLLHGLLGIFVLLLIYLSF